MTEYAEWRAFLTRHSIPCRDGELDGRKTLDIDVPTWPYARVEPGRGRTLSFLFYADRFAGINDRPFAPAK